VARKMPTLPPVVATPADVGRLLSEANRLDEVMLQLKLRQGGEASAKLPKTSRLFDLTVEHNALNMLKEEDRRLLKNYLKLAWEKAARLHFSFSSDPSAAFLEKLVTWLRQEIDPHLLVTVGLQPGIGAGCIVRSTNKQFDLSLRQTFTDQQQLLLEKMGLGQGAAK
jgi:F0F1-type ATP synthase delta subunit